MDQEGPLLPVAGARGSNSVGVELRSVTVSSSSSESDSDRGIGNGNSSSFRCQCCPVTGSLRVMGRAHCSRLELLRAQPGPAPETVPPCQTRTVFRVAVSSTVTVHARPAAAGQE